MNTLFSNLEKENPKINEEVNSTNDEPFVVLLYNDDVHSFDEVILQLIKALRCTVGQAKGLAFQAHVNGKTAVFAGSLNKCMNVTSILEQINLNTEIIT